MKINKICTGDYNGTIKFINPKNGFSDRTIYYNSSQINLIRQIPFYSRIAVAAAPNILTYEVGSDNTLPLETYIGHKKCVTSLDFFGDRTKMASCSEDKTVKIWDFKLPNKVNEFINDEPLCGVNVIDDNTIMSCDYEGNLNLFDQRKHGLLKNNYIGRDISFTSISANTSKSLLAATDLKGDCFVFEMDKNYDLELIKRFSAHKSYNLRCGFNSASDFLVTCSADKTAKKWDVVNNFECLCTFSNHSDWVSDFSLSFDENHLATCSADKTVCVWNLKTGALESTFNIEGHPLSTVTAL